VTMRHGGLRRATTFAAATFPAVFKPWPDSARRRLDPPMSHKSLTACFQEAGICIAGGGVPPFGVPGGTTPAQSWLDCKSIRSGPSCVWCPASSWASLCSASPYPLGGPQRAIGLAWIGKRFRFRNRSGRGSRKGRRSALWERRRAGVRCRLDDVEHLLAERPNELFGVHRFHAPDHAGREVLFDAIGRGRGRCAQEDGPTCSPSVTKHIRLRVQ